MFYCALMLQVKYKTCFPTQLTNVYWKTSYIVHFYACAKRFFPTLTRNVSVEHRCHPMTKSHNSCKTCNITKSNIYSDFQIMFVTGYGYEQNPSRGVVGVAHTRFRVVRTDGQTDLDVQILMPTHNSVVGIIIMSLYVFIHQLPWFYFHTRTNTIKDSNIVSLSKKLYSHCLALVSSRNGFQRDFTIKLKQEMFIKHYAP